MFQTPQAQAKGPLLEFMEIKYDKTFRTKSGYCHILQDKIVFSKDGDLEKALTEKGQNHNSKSFKILFAFILCILIYFVYDQYKKEIIDLNTLTISLIACPFIYFFVALGLNYETIAQIDRKKINKTQLHSRTHPLTYPKFIIYFDNEMGKKKVTAVVFRDPNLFGKTDMENAIRILREENLIETKK